MRLRQVTIAELAHASPGSFKIGPFGSSLKKEDLAQHGVPVVGIENVLDRTFRPPFRRFISQEKYQELRQYTIEPGNVLVTTMGTIGRSVVVPDNIETMIMDSHLFRMRVDTNRVLPAYLSYAINDYEGIKQQLDRMARGAIMDGLNTTILKECTLALPTIAEQQRIISILDKADRLRRLQRFSLRLSEGYLQSVFLQMFGDPEKNPMGWGKMTIDDVLEFSQYGTSEKSNSARKGYPVLGMGNITYSGEIDIEQLAYVDLPEADFKRLKLEPGDIIFNRTNSTDLVGKTAKWNLTIDAVVASYLVRLRLKSMVLPDYFVTLLNTRRYKELFRARCKKAIGQSNISPTLIREFPLPVPPLLRQQQFERLIQPLERLRRQQREALRQAERLFDTLLHKAFEGELSEGDGAAVDSLVEEAAAMVGAKGRGSTAGADGV